MSNKVVRRDFLRSLTGGSLAIMTGRYAWAEEKFEPDWIQVPFVRCVQSYRTATRNDTESQLNAGHGYTVSWGWDREGDDDESASVHEETHGINARVRNQYGRGTTVDNAFYCLNRSAIVVPQGVPLTMREVAQYVPPSLKGAMYRQHIAQQIGRDWHRQPLYVADEWTAYTNSLICHYEWAKRYGSGGSVSDAAFAVQSGINTLAAMMAFQAYKIDYPHDKLKKWVVWNWNRMIYFWVQLNKSGVGLYPDAMRHLNGLRQPRDAKAKSMREWALWYFGERECREIFRI